MDGSRGHGLQLADEFFLVAHDQEAERMRPRMQPVALGIGLASALLAELMLAGIVGQRDGYILGASRVRLPPGAASDARNRVSIEVVERIASSPGQPMQYWISELRHLSTDGVRDRLINEGVLREAKGRRWWGGSSVAYQAVDENLALAPEVRLYGLLGDHRSVELDLPAAVLVGLVEATGLLGKISLWDGSAGSARDHAAALRAELPEPLRGLLSHTETSVGAALLSSRHH